jgi:hypothetical protein
VRERAAGHRETHEFVTREEWLPKRQSPQTSRGSGFLLLGEPNIDHRPKSLTSGTLESASLPPAPSMTFSGTDDTAGPRPVIILDMRFLKGRPNLPIVTLKRAA